LAEIGKKIFIGNFYIELNLYAFPNLNCWTSL